ncbi:MAG TPA: DUF4214 domain-containing protein [Iamia sp.]|nr:DUF4214 domain-containing protein [Iamia sp.]
MRPTAVAVAITLVAGAAVVMPAPVASAVPVPVQAPADDDRAACGPTPFTAGFAAALRSRWPGQRFSAAVHDRRTGCSYDYRADLRLTTASVLKAEILAGILLRAQAEGRGLTQWEKNNIGPMIARSADPEANALWSSLGGIAGMERVDAAFGLTQTDQNSPWGITTTSARDRTRLMRLLVNGDGGPLGAAYRATARSYLLSVVPSQRWGITAGVPPGSSVPLKNGFFSSQCCRWRLNSSGVVEIGAGYVVTILTDRWPNEAAGIQGNEFVARAINARLAGPFAPFASPAAFVDRQYADIVGRTPTFAELSRTTEAIGFSTGRAPAVVESLLGSPSYANLGPPLLRIYLGALGRMPTAVQFAHRMWQLRTGRETLRSIADEAGWSADVTGGQRLTNEEFVDRVVTRIMGWPPDQASVDYWAGRLSSSASTIRGDVIRAYTESDESRWRRAHPVAIASVHLTLLGRAPDAAAVARWEQRFADGASLGDLIGTIYRSSEYRARVT